MIFTPNPACIHLFNCSHIPSAVDKAEDDVRVAREVFALAGRKLEQAEMKLKEEIARGR